MVNMDEILELVIERDASDVHLICGNKPILRIARELEPIEEMEEEIKNFKQENPESYVVVILHWGIEYQSSPTLNQRKGAHRLVRAGADVIIGHHPHIIQKEEYFNGKPIFYSLGNFVFDQRKPETSQSLIVQLNFTSIGYSIKLHPATINNCKPELQ